MSPVVVNARKTAHRLRMVDNEESLSTSIVEGDKTAQRVSKAAGMLLGAIALMAAIGFVVGGFLSMEPSSAAFVCGVWAFVLGFVPYIRAASKPLQLTIDTTGVRLDEELVAWVDINSIASDDVYVHVNSSSGRRSIEMSRYPPEDVERLADKLREIHAKHALDEEAAEVADREAKQRQAQLAGVIDR